MESAKTLAEITPRAEVDDHLSNPAFEQQQMSAYSRSTHERRSAFLPEPVFRKILLVGPCRDGGMAKEFGAALVSPRYFLAIIYHDRQTTLDRSRIRIEMLKRGASDFSPENVIWT